MLADYFSQGECHGENPSSVSPDPHFFTSKGNHVWRSEQRCESRRVSRKSLGQGSEEAGFAGLHYQTVYGLVTCEEQPIFALHQGTNDFVLDFRQPNDGTVFWVQTLDEVLFCHFLSIL